MDDRDKKADGEGLNMLTLAIGKSTKSMKRLTTISKSTLRGLGILYALLGAYTYFNNELSVQQFYGSPLTVGQVGLFLFFIGLYWFWNNS